MNIDSRMERWIKVSIGLGRFEPYMMPLIQSLGRLDVQLCAKDHEIIDAYKGESRELEYSDVLHDHITLSYLWVLGAYEAIRTLTQQIREGRDNMPSEVFERSKETRDRFARLRMPLAKMEPASAHKETDSHIAYPGLNTQYGITWQLNENVFVSRRELSDFFLDTLEFARIAKLRQQASRFNNSLNTDSANEPRQ